MPSTALWPATVPSRPRRARADGPAAAKVALGRDPSLAPHAAPLAHDPFDSAASPPGRRSPARRAAVMHHPWTRVEQRLYHAGSTGGRPPRLRAGPAGGRLHRWRRHARLGRDDWRASLVGERRPLSCGAGAASCPSHSSRRKPSRSWPRSAPTVPDAPSRCAGLRGENRAPRKPAEIKKQPKLHEAATTTGGRPILSFWPRVGMPHRHVGERTDPPSGDRRGAGRALLAPRHRAGVRLAEAEVFHQPRPRLGHALWVPHRRIQQLLEEHRAELPRH